MVFFARMLQDNAPYAHVKNHLWPNVYFSFFFRLKVREKTSRFCPRINGGKSIQSILGPCSWDKIETNFHATEIKNCIFSRGPCICRRICTGTKCYRGAIFLSLFVVFFKNHTYCTHIFVCTKRGVTHFFFFFLFFRAYLMKQCQHIMHTKKCLDAPYLNQTS